MEYKAAGRIGVGVGRYASSSEICTSESYITWSNNCTSIRCVRQTGKYFSGTCIIQSNVSARTSVTQTDISAAILTYTVELRMSDIWYIGNLLPTENQQTNATDDSKNFFYRNLFSDFFVCVVKILICDSIHISFMIAVEMKRYFILGCDYIHTFIRHLGSKIRK